jgi:hypothetical protein
MGVRGWRELSKERTEWKKITEKAKTPIKEEEEHDGIHHVQHFLDSPV